MKQKQAYKYRFYPTDEQKRLLAKTFGCCRYVYNWGLRLRTDAYYQEHKRLYYNDLSAALTQLKKTGCNSMARGCFGCSVATILEASG